MRLIDSYCQMCEKAEQSGANSRSKNSYLAFGQQLHEELRKKDNITHEEEIMILDDCKQKYGSSHMLYEKIAQVMLKIYNEVHKIHR